MSVQNFTKGLRDKSVSILDRKASAQAVLDGSMPLNLPQKPVVILDWVFSALSTEPGARSSNEFWTFLSKLWPQCDADSQSKIARSYKLPNILLDTWKQNLDNETMDAIDHAINLILGSTLLGCNSDAQAGSLILGYCNHLHGRPTNILPVYEKQMISRSKIFKKMDKVLETICGIPNNQPFLVDYFEMREADPICPKSALAEVMRAIVISKVQIGDRFIALATKYPESLDILLQNLGDAKLPNERETLRLLIDKQISLYNWDALSILLARVPVETVAKLEDLFGALNSHFNQPFAISLLQKCAQTRKLEEFATLWSNQSNEQWFSSDITTVMAACLEQLSKAQLIELLNSLHKNGQLHILPKLSYRAVSAPAIHSKLLELLDLHDPTITFCVLSLWPLISQQHPETITKVEALKSPECSLLLLERQINTSYPAGLEPLDAGAVVSRFYKVLSNPEKVIGYLNAEQTANALSIKDIWEYKTVSAALVEHHLQNKFDTTTLVSAPLQALSKKHKEALLTLAWKQKNLELIDLLLKTPPRSTDCEAKPKMLVELAGKLSESQCSIFLEVAFKLVRNEAYAKQLLSIVKPKKHWYETCLAVAATVGTGASCGPEDPLVKLLESNLKAQKNLKSSILCLDYLQKSGIPANVEVLGSVLSSGDNEDQRNVFGLLCQSTRDWQAVTACFIYTGCQYVDPFLAFVQTLDAENIVLLIRECIQGRHYKATQTLFSGGELVKEQVIPFVTLMVQTVYTYPGQLSEIQAVEYFEMAAHLVRENSWVLTQYALETLLMTIPKIASREFGAQVNDPELLYCSLCFFLGQALLFQRHRLQSRNHLLVSALSGLVKCLSGSKFNDEQRRRVGNLPGFVAASRDLGRSVKAAESLVRVMTIFCDPPQRSVRENSGKNNLTSSVARIRRYVAKTAGVLVSNYATISLQYGFSSEIAGVMNNVIFPVFVVLGTQELKSTMAAMDNASRAYIKSVYDNYQAMGKWKKD